MDNLKFTISDIVREEKISLRISTTTLKDFLYDTVIIDFLDCQKPRVMLTPLACLDIIIDNISEIRYDYDSISDKIVCTIPVLAKLNIYFELLRRHTDPPIRVSLAKLESRIENLETHEIIESFFFPKWETIDEFMKLPNFPIIETSCKSEKYVETITIRDSQVTKPEIRGPFLVHDGLYYIFPERYYFPCGRPDGNETLFREKLKTYVETREDKNCSEIRKTFPLYPSVPVMKFGISVTVSEYISRYVVGWIHRNFPFFAKRGEIHVRCVCSTENFSIQCYILRTRRLEMQMSKLSQIGSNGPMSYRMPEIKSFLNIDGVEILE